MRVLFDLRPRGLAQMQDGRIDPLRWVSVLLFGTFVVISLFNIAYMALGLRQLRARLETVRGEQAVLAEQRARVDAKIGDMRAGRERLKEYVDFSKEEMPSVEFLGALEGAVPSGIKITKLEMKPGHVLLRGVALADQDIIDLGGKLGSMKGIVGRVDAPVTAKAASGGSATLEFSMSCAVGTVSEMAAASPDLSVGGGAR